MQSVNKITLYQGLYSSRGAGRGTFNESARLLKGARVMIAHRYFTDYSRLCTVRMQFARVSS